MTRSLSVFSAAALLISCGPAGPGTNVPNPAHLNQMPAGTERQTADQVPDPLRTLFLGASYFTSAGGSYQPLEGFCEAAGLECEAVSQGTLPERWSAHGVEFLELGAPVRTPAEAAANPDVHRLIERGNFDFVVLWAGLATTGHPASIPRLSDRPFLVCTRATSNVSA